MRRQKNKNEKAETQKKKARMIELLKRIASDAKEIDEQQKDICEIDEGLPYCMLVPERARKEYRRNRHSSTGTVTATELTTFALRMVSASVVSQRHRLKEVVMTEIMTTEIMTVIVEAPRKEERGTKSRPSALAGLSITQVRLHV